MRVNLEDFMGTLGLRVCLFACLFPTETALSKDTVDQELQPSHHREVLLGNQLNIEKR